MEPQRDRQAGDQVYRIGQEHCVFKEMIQVSCILRSLDWPRQTKKQEYHRRTAWGTSDDMGERKSNSGRNRAGVTIKNAVAIFASSILNVASKNKVVLHSVKAHIFCLQSLLLLPTLGYYSGRCLDKSTRRSIEK
jgi:hypothetical protein